MRIRELVYEDLEKASLLLWASYYQAEKNHTSLAGMELFRDLTSPVSLSINAYFEEVVLLGAFQGEILLGVGAVKDKNRILLLYVHPDHQNNGIGGALLSYMEALCEGESIELNASRFALSFYAARGYLSLGPEREEKGIVFTPMRKKREK
jgi:GNAT superfamily N-acetyltransferase